MSRDSITDTSWCKNYQITGYCESKVATMLYNFTTMNKLYEVPSLLDSAENL